ncbi:MAG: hypothetical protein RLN76_00670 [Phycisphaeraceae bacterium]
MNQTHAVVALALILSTTPCLAVDRKLMPVADGAITYSGVGNSTTGSTLHTEWGEGPSQIYTGRRILMKFDTSWSSAVAFRDAKLYLYGGHNGTASQVNVYHYDDDNFSEASMPFPSDFRSRYLTNRVITNTWIGPGYAGIWYEFDIGAGLTGWEQDGYLSLCLRNATNSFNNSASFVSRNSQTWNGTKGYEPFIIFATYGALQITDPDFRNGLGNWSVDSGGGTAITRHNPYLENDELLQMIAGSPVTVSQVLDTPMDPFYLTFAYEHQTSAGALTIRLTDRDGRTLDLGHLVAPETLPEPGLRQGYARIEDPTWLGLDHVTLSLTYDGPSGAQVWLDDILFADAVPEPASLIALTILALAPLGTRPRTR